jgi:glycosyltransferase involved in cell wall biosynthesis
MKKFFFLLSISYVVIFLINITWIILNLYLWTTEGIDFVLSGSQEGLFENIYYSVYFKWIIFINIIWLSALVGFMLRQKHFKTNPEQHFLKHNPIEKPKICITIAAYNEENSIEKVITDFMNQKFVESVIVVDNKSTDKTVFLAEKCGAIVIKQKKNMGFGHSYAIGLQESLKQDVNIVVTAEADGTNNAYDLDKMIPYLGNADMVIGSRQVQIFTQKGNQNTIMHVWGNFFLAKLIQFKYFSLHHFGIINLSDVGCLFRVVRRDALEKLVDKFIDPKSGDAIGGPAFPLYLTMRAIEKDLKIVEIPLTFNKRIGESKTNSNKKIPGIVYGLKFLKFILLY